MVKSDLTRAEQSFSGEDYAFVELLLDEETTIEAGRKVSPIKLATAESQELQERVINHYKTKRNLRDKTVENEKYLRQRLDDKTLIDAKLSSGDKITEHLNQVACDRVKLRSREMFQRAKANYSESAISLDKIIRYEPGKNDGRMSTDDYRSLISEQDGIISLVENGDEALAELDAYNDEVHEQHFIFVSDNTKTAKSFRHTRIRFRTESYRSGKHTRTRTVPYTETYHTNGFQYFYTTTRVTQGGITTSNVYAGEKDGAGSSYNYDYGKQRTKGWVIEWKKLHEDNSMKHSGTMDELKPRIEEVPESCK